MYARTLRQTVDDYGLMAKKNLGQNFLLDQNITDKIIRLSLQKQGLEDFSFKEVLEIGPGPGGLTRAILDKKPQHLTVIEMDNRCIEIMRDLQRQTDVDMTIFSQDALKTDIASISKNKLQVVSNLPYNISVPLLTLWLKKASHIEAMTLMFQKEVADRIMAAPGTKAYGRLSVLAQLICRIEGLMTLNRECFVPAPKILSSVLLFRPFDEVPDLETIEKVEKLTMLAFSGRRKMLRQSLKSIEDIEKRAKAAHVSLNVRAEDVSPFEYLKMASCENRF